jgi:drug/metabolite transporter (DMT)-like permease
MNAIRTKMTGFDWFLLVFLSLLWGASFIFTEVALRELPPLSIVTIRVGLAALILNAVILIKRQELMLPGRAWKECLIMAVLGNVLPFTLLVWGQLYITASLSAILNATMPFFTVILAHYITQDEKARAHRFLGVLIGLGGAVVIIGPSVIGELGMHAWGELAGVAAAISYAFAAIYARRFGKRRLPSLSVAAGQMSGATLLLLPAALLIETPWLLPMPGVDTWLALLAYGAFSTALAFVIYYHMIATVGATNISLVTFMIPVSSIALGIIFLGEMLEIHQLIGMILIGAGLLAIDGRLINRVFPHFS